ncbi:hypothetical protein [Thermoactinomyces sp. CICC 10521]|uniref:amino acid kinase family protein n=1 Tax=Thermoactinomyces sp. CICC 10521 TaxID=2767426 RepID=UPI0018DC4A54|nr:hypothetical protein [Thermoactinomyces sp. CICC 10521]MBH8608765.1 hypothetical protein [Thermoactinomyces sp. CICC 10521]
MKPILVMKFGGTSLNTIDKRRRVAIKVAQALTNGFQPVVVVSAMGRKGEPYATDSLAQFLSTSVLSRNHAHLLACGEIISSVTIAAEISNFHPAVALIGKETGLQTDSGYVNAKIKRIDPTCILEWIEKNYIPVIAGFQATNVNGELTLLKRGGSDVSATAIGWALQATAIEIYTDTPGMMTADPKIVPNAKVIPELTYRLAYRLTSQGAKVLHCEAIEWAQLRSIPIYIKSLDDDTEQTKISNTLSANDQKLPVFITNQSVDSFTDKISLILNTTNVSNRILFPLSYKFNWKTMMFNQHQLTFFVSAHKTKHLINYLHDEIYYNLAEVKFIG